MLLDVFLYAGEAEMAQLRQETLGRHVEAMIAVSCDRTYQGEKVEYAPPPAGIEWKVVSVVPPEARSEWGSHSWGFVENQHREAVMGIVDEWAKSNPSNDLVVMVSDVDEIPDPITLSEVENRADEYTEVVVPMRMHGFALDYLHPNQPWFGTVASPLLHVDPQSQRNRRGQMQRAGSGWHFSWMGDMETKQRKLASFSHGELQGKLDLEDCYRNARHSNGEQMRRLQPSDMEALKWPPPLFAGFPIPDSWWSPQ